MTKNDEIITWKKQKTSLLSFPHMTQKHVLALQFTGLSNQKQLKSPHPSHQKNNNENINQKKHQTNYD